MNIEDIEVGDLLRVNKQRNVYEVTRAGGLGIDVRYAGKLVGKLESEIGGPDLKLKQAAGSERVEYTSQHPRSFSMFKKAMEVSGEI